MSSFFFYFDVFYVFVFFIFYITIFIFIFFLVIKHTKCQLCLIIMRIDAIVSLMVTPLWL